MTGSRVGAGAGSFWQVGLVAGLQMGQVFRCSSYLGLVCISSIYCTVQCGSSFSGTLFFSFMKNDLSEQGISVENGTSTCAIMFLKRILAVAD